MPIVEEPVVIEKIVTETVVEEVIVEVYKSQIIEINETTLGEPAEVKEVVCVISNKRLVLLDEDVDGTSGKVLSYCFDLLTTDNKTISYFVAQSVYDNFSVADRLVVTYNVYRNSDGVEYPTVVSIKAE